MSDSKIEASTLLTLEGMSHKYKTLNLERDVNANTSNSMRTMTEAPSWWDWTCVLSGLHHALSVSKEACLRLNLHNQTKSFHRPQSQLGHRGWEYPFPPGAIWTTGCEEIAHGGFVRTKGQCLFVVTIGEVKRLWTNTLSNVKPWTPFTKSEVLDFWWNECLRKFERTQWQRLNPLKLNWLTVEGN